jgi:hypothetical protein
MTTYTEALVEALGTNKWTIAAKVIKEQEEKELVEWLFWAFEALVTGNLWDDMTPRSLNNDFNWEKKNAHRP